MKYFHKFENTNALNAYRDTSYGEPWVSYTADKDDVDYNIVEGTQEWDDFVLKTIPLTFDILTDGKITWSKRNLSIDNKTIYYSLNGGNYIEITAEDTEGSIINVTAGDSIRFKGNNFTYGMSVNQYNWYGCCFGGTAKFNIKGNIHSLLYGADFRNTVNLNSVGYTFCDLFYNCINLISAKKLILPATTLAQYCYYRMFYGCNNLEEAPESLPATSLKPNCYYYMFANCGHLKVSPKLCCTTIGNGYNNCYYMFNNCYNLRYINCQLLTNPSGTSYTQYWVSGVNSIGLFVKNPDMTNDWTRDVSHVPTNWKIGTFSINKQSISVDGEENTTSLEIVSEYPWQITSKPNWINIDKTNSSDIYTEINITIESYNDSREGILVFTSNGETYSLPITQSIDKELSVVCLSLNGGAIYFKRFGSLSDLSIEYSLNDGEWTSVTSNNSTDGALISNMNYGDVVRLRGNNSYYATSTSNYCSFKFTTSVELRGNIMSLINSTNYTSLYGFSTNYTFYKLFANCTTIVYADTLKLKAQTLTNYCYASMFDGCTNLHKAPELLATILAQYSCQYMFQKCERMQKAPELLATTLDKFCCYAMFKSCNKLEIPPSALLATTLKESCYEQMFQECTLLKTTPKFLFTTAAKKGCSSMFYSCTNLIKAEDLIATNVSQERAYQSMFANCTSLTEMPKLPSTNYTGDYCCEHMFSSCYSLTSVYNFNATSLGSNCFQYMFSYCTGLINVPNMPVSSTASLTRYCFEYMFANCTSLINAPALPWTTLAMGCYKEMFCNCTSLTTAPELPALTLAHSCYESMFAECINLTNPPELPATTLVSACYSNMFRGCTSLTTAPELPAENLPLLTVDIYKSNGYYYRMFANCTSLTEAPELPARSLSQFCYSNMFTGCTSLTSAPILLATTLQQGCYQEMFKNCSNLNYIEAMFTTTPDDTYTSDWVNGVSETGTFVKHPDAEWNVTGVNGVPENWTIKYEISSGMLVSENSTITVSSNGSVSGIQELNYHVVRRFISSNKEDDFIIWTFYDDQEQEWGWWTDSSLAGTYTGNLYTVKNTDEYGILQNSYYLQLPLPFTAGDRIQMKFRLIGPINTLICGAQTDNNGTKYNRTTLSINSYKQFVLNGTINHTSSRQNFLVGSDIMQLNKDYELDFNCASNSTSDYLIDDSNSWISSCSLTKRPESTTQNLCIGTYNDSTGPIQPQGAMWLYYFKLIDNQNNVKIHIVPTTVNGIPTFYDNVSETIINKSLWQ